MGDFSWVCITLILHSGGVIAQVPEPVRRSELLALLRHECGSCHGMRLTGGLGPPLTQKALQGRAALGLATTILQGRPGTPMPPWRQWIVPAEAKWLVDQLKSGKLGEP